MPGGLFLTTFLILNCYENKTVTSIALIDIKLWKTKRSLTCLSICGASVSGRSGAFFTPGFTEIRTEAAGLFKTCGLKL